MANTEPPSGLGTIAPEGRHLPNLEGVRGLCASAVLFYHVAFAGGLLGMLNEPKDPFWGVVASGLEVFLPPFFVLSGFLLYRSFARATITGAPWPALGNFMWRRVLRIVPGFWVVTIVTLLVMNLHSINGIWYVLRPLLMLHSFKIENFPVGMEPTWTVTTEFAFYLVLPPFAWLIARYARRADDPVRRARRIMLPLAGFVAFGVVWHVYCSLPSLRQSSPFGMSDLTFWPPHYAGTFAIGMALAVLAVRAETAAEPPRLYRLVRQRPNLCWLAALAVFAVNLYKPFGPAAVPDWSGFTQAQIDYVLSLTFAALFVAPLTVPGVRWRFADAVLANAPVRFLGRISYGVYLWHMLVLDVAIGEGSINGRTAPMDPVAYQAAGMDVGMWPLLAITFFGTVAVAAASHYLFERPVARLGHRWPRAPRPVPDPALAPQQTG
ncbi:acyltransferase [Actinomadura sp. NPDC047616]|uniref:acyltransferase family protein n=1 Tax=Actinomadura sp. NPDC047616 TaxID=3155914 RepID=UPI0033EAB619